MEKAIRYTFLDENTPNELKTIQEAGSSIKGLSFTPRRINEMRKREGANNYAVYFLFSDETLAADSKIYIGQSKQGIARIDNHRREKKFWTRCFMFVTDNNSFDANAIDFLEYYFIHRFKKIEHYSLINTEQREKEPNLNEFDRTAYNKYIHEIEFLLRAEGVMLDAPKKERASQKKKTKPLPHPKDTQPLPLQERHYFPWKSKAGQVQLYIEDGAFWIEAGALIPPPTTNTSQTKILETSQRLRREYEKSKHLEARPEGGHLSLKPIAFKSPSAAAEFLRGRSTTGKEDFVGLQEFLSAEEGKTK